MTRFIVYSLMFFMLWSCEQDGKDAAEIAKLDIRFTTERFDKAFASATPEALPKLKQAFPFMFPQKFEDAFWIDKMQDTLQQELNRETLKAFADFNTEEKEIKSLFQHLKYYFLEFKTPRVITATSNVDYRNKIIVTDTITLISLDTYLGADHYFYTGIQDYIRVDLKREQMVVDMATEYAKRFIYQPQRKNLRDEFIYAGKQLYFKDMVIPFKTDAEKIGYTQDQLDWAIANEEFIWRYFVDRELLFSTDSKLPNRFINPAPFSKFYLEAIDNESPGRIGQYIGWQIIRAYMKNNDVSLQQMLTENAEHIFNNAKFKPRR